jgi:radical SAM protein with 4Fe4S-binding SPASM domain
MLNTCITLNEKYIPFFESFSVMLLEKILGGYEPYYPDLLSPCGAFDIQIAYDLNGNVFTCDDARFGKGIPIGTIHESLATLKEHQFLLDIKKYSKTTESFCGACAYRPWCGRCPIMNLKQGIAMDAKSIHSNYCKHMEGTFDAIFDLIIEDRGRIESYFKLARATKLL